MNEFQRKLLDEVATNDYIAAFADPKREILAIDNYSYSVRFGDDGLVINDTAERVRNLDMDTDSTFIMTYISGCARAAGVEPLIYNPSVLVQITDQSSMKSYFNRPTLMPLIAGAGGFPFLTGSPRIVAPRSTLKITAIAATTQAFTYVNLSFGGGRIFYKN